MYQVDDLTYGSGFDKELCARRGKIVEEWPVNSVAEARFVASHGSAHGDASKRVSALADAVKALYTDTLTSPIILEEAEWRLLVAEKQVVLEKERDDAIKQVIQQKDNDISRIRANNTAYIDQLLADASVDREQIIDKSRVLDDKKTKEISDLRQLKDSEIVEINENHVIELDAMSQTRDELLINAESEHALEIRQCIEEKGKILDDLVNRGFFKRIVLACRIVFMRKT